MTALAERRVTGARRAANEVLRRVFEHGAWANRALPAALRRHGAGPERGLAQRLAYGSVQRRGTSDHLIRMLSGRSVDELDPAVVASLRLGLYELLFLGSPSDHAAVDQAVELAKGSPRGARAASFANAILRRAARERAELLAGLDDGDPESAAACHSYPAWLAQRWWDELGGEATVALMAAGNEPAELALRANRLRTDRDAALAALRANGVDAGPAPGPAPLDVPESIVVRGPLGEGARLIEDGDAVPQSRASAAAVALLDPRPGDRVLDLCAAPGIKTTQVAARMRNEGEIVAVEVHSGRASQLRELGARLGARIARIEEADAADADLGDGYDRVLVDPPCSDLGTLASRPDARWRKSPRLIERLAAVQERILARAADALRPGGTLVYSTCTISKAENEAVVASLLARADGLEADDLGSTYPQLASRRDPRFLQTRPDRDRTDGFFVARLRRREG